MVAMTICQGCYGDMLWLLWGLMGVAKGTRCGYALMPCGFVDMSETELGN